MKFIKTAAAALVGIGLALAPVSAQAATTDQASGAGTLDEGARHFSFNAKRLADGTVKGQANLVNTSGPGKPFHLKIDVSCLKVVGNVAVFGGIGSNSGDTSFDGEAVFFTVQDNGEPGKDRDAISRVYAWDDDPTTTGNPQACQFTGANDFDFETIGSGNIQVK